MLYPFECQFVFVFVFLGDRSAETVWNAGFYRALDDFCTVPVSFSGLPGLPLGTLCESDFARELRRHPSGVLQCHRTSSKKKRNTMSTVRNMTFVVRRRT